LAVVGPEGIEARFVTAAEALFPGSSSIQRRYQLRFVELARETPLAIGGVTVTPFEVNHPSGAPSYALRLVVGDKVLAFSGDTEWTESLIAAGAGADLYISECYAFDGVPRYHMSWRKIEAELPRMAPKRVLLTHMSDAMLAKRHEVKHPAVVMAEDGLVLDV
jgi:ribonuclease BN (tRNA processing enzyme)